MEDTLRGALDKGACRQVLGLNPCFNGRYSQSNPNLSIFNKVRKVLILVLMEDTLRGGSNRWCSTTKDSLNPCFNGRYSQRRC